MAQPVQKKTKCERTFLFTPESLIEGNPWQEIDEGSDATLDTVDMRQDRHSKVACDTATKGTMVKVAGLPPYMITPKFTKPARLEKEGTMYGKGMMGGKGMMDAEGMQYGKGMAGGKGMMDGNGNADDDDDMQCRMMDDIPEPETVQALGYLDFAEIMGILAQTVTDIDSLASLATSHENLDDLAAHLAENSDLGDNEQQLASKCIQEQAMKRDNVC